MKIVYLACIGMLSFVSVGAQVKTGIDVLEQQHFSQLREIAARHNGSLRLGVLTNPVGVDFGGRRTVDVLRGDGEAAIPGLKVVRLFSGEHGINAALQTTNISDDVDPASNLPIVSIYGSTDEQRHPSDKQVAGLDAVVVDLQDVGVRYWTFQTLMKYFLQISQKNNLDIIVLDRPNPVNGVEVQGPLSTPGRENYVNPSSEPIRPGLTMGELAEYFNGEDHLNARLTVIKMTGWRRSDWYDDTGLLWINPSPNLRSLTQSLVYTGTGLLEGTNVNVKGPSEQPFVRFGAPWISATRLAAYLNSRKIPGVSFMPVFYVPVTEGRSPFAGQRVDGVEIQVNDRNLVDTSELGIETISALWKLYPKEFQIDKVDRLLLNESVLSKIKAGEDPRSIASKWQPDLDAYKARRARYLLY